jgi:hypothetical protein
MEEFDRGFVYNLRKENCFMKKLVVFSLALLMVAAFVAAAVNVSGEWDMTSKTPQGERTRPVTFVQDGEKLTVKTVGRDGQEMIATGTVKGNDIEWSMTRTTPQGEFTVTYKGKVEGDKMAGTMTMGDRTMEWTAVKKAK